MSPAEALDWVGDYASTWIAPEWPTRLSEQTSEGTIGGWRQPFRNLGKGQAAGRGTKPGFEVSAVPSGAVLYFRI